MFSIDAPKYQHHDRALLEEAYNRACKKGYRANVAMSAILGIGLVTVPLSLVVGAVKIGSVGSFVYGLAFIVGMCVGLAIHPYREAAALRRLERTTDQIYNQNVANLELFNRVKGGTIG